MTLTLNQALMGLAGGVASALLFAAMFAGGPLATPLFVLFALPVAIASLGWGSLSGALAALVAAALVALVAGWPVGVAHALLAGVPMAFHAHRLGLARPRDDADPAAGLEWYPLDRVFAGLVGLTAVSLIVAFLAAGLSTDESAVGIADALIEMSGSGGDMTEADRAAVLEVARLYLRLLPVFAGLFWVAVMTLDLWLAARVVRTSGRLQRPWPDLAREIRLPVVYAGAFAAAAVLAFSGGVVGLAAGAVAGAFGMGFVFQGLAVVHVLTRGNPARPLLLSATYVFLFVFSPTLVALVLLGVVDAVKDLRARKDKPAGPAR